MCRPHFREVPSPTTNWSPQSTGESCTTTFRRGVRSTPVWATWIGAQNFSFYLPKGIRILGAMYLRIQLPAISGATYKPYPGLYPIKDIRIMSGGQQVYLAPYTMFLADHMQSLTEHCAKEFGKTYLGYETAPSGDARDIMCPILLPNSAYMDRAGPSTRGHGIFPAVMENNRVEIQLTLHSGKYLTSDTSVAVGSIKGKCSYMFHEVRTTAEKQAILQDKRGLFRLDPLRHRKQG